MSEFQQLLQAIKSLQQAVNSIEFKVGQVMTRQEMLESSVARMFARLELNGTARKEVLPVSPATTARSNSMSPVPPRLPGQPLPAGRPQIQSSKSVGGGRPPTHRRPDSGGCYTGTMAAQDMMGEPILSASSPRFIQRSSMPGGYDDVSLGGPEDAYTSNLRSCDIEGEDGGNYTHQLTTDSFVDEPGPLLVSMTIEASVGKPNAVHLYNSISREPAKPVIPAVPTGKRPLSMDATKPRSPSLGKEPEDDSSYGGRDIYTVEETGEETRKSVGNEGEDAWSAELQGPVGEEEWDKYPEFDVEKFSQFRRCTRDEAAARLAGHADGVYLIRPCGDTSLKNNPDVFVLSFFGRSSGGQRSLTNIKIFRARRGKTRGLKLGGHNPELFPSLEELLKHHLPDLRPFEELSERLIPRQKAV